MRGATFAALAAGFLGFARVTLGEEVAGLAELARAIESSRDGTSRLPETGVDPARAPDLERIGRDASRPRAERCAALVMLGRLDPARRDDSFRTVFEPIAPRHVHAAESFVEGLKRISFAAEDLPTLACRGLSGGGEGRRDPFAAMALVAVGLVDDPRSLDVLLLAPDTALGDAGRIRDPAYHGLFLLCRNPARRDALWDWLSRTPESSAARSRAVLVLATHRDERAVLPLAALIRGLAPRPEALKLPPGERPLRVPLPQTLAEPHVLEIARDFGEPRLGPPILEYIYAGGTGTGIALPAASACGATLDVDRLWPLLDLDREHVSDHGPILLALGKMIGREDGPRVAALLARDRWDREDFYLPVTWTREMEPRLLAPELRDALIPVAREHPNLAVRRFAIEALGRFPGDEVSAVLRCLLDEQPSETALQAVLGRAADPWTIFLDAFDGNDPAQRLAARRLIEWRFNSSSDAVYDPTPAQKTELVRRSLARLAATPAGDDPAPILRILYMLLVDGPLRRPAERSADVDLALFDALAKRCEADRDVATMAASCLWAMRGERAREILLLMAERHPDEEVRRAARAQAEELGR